MGIQSRPAALVTGGSSGIGLAIARVLAEEGHDLTLVGRRADALDDAARTLRDATGADVFGVPADVGDPAAPGAIVAAHAQRRGRLDVLVNNAGVAMQGAIDRLSERRVDVQLDVNLAATIKLYHHAVPLLRDAPGGALVLNTASISGHAPVPMLSVYSAAKAGVIAFTDAMNKEHGDAGIKSTALCPGWVDTPILDTADGFPPRDELIQTGDVAELVRALLRLSPSCVVPEIRFHRPGGRRF